ncbi:MAG: hypothetical protein INH41_02325 [Myxococcaceae bacterium]|nr:hypothetical protein [Myxococcaceae bacterium]
MAFCCKGRGWCPSCTNRRAVETGVRLAALLPRVRHRQWTLSIPFTLRVVVGFSLHADTAVQGNDRQGLERLCRYGSRGRVAESLTAPARRRPLRVLPQGEGRLRPPAQRLRPHRRRLDWASLHRHTLGTDVLRCPCGGRRRLHVIHSTRKTAKGAPPPTRPPPCASSRPPARHRPTRPPAGWLTDTVSRLWPSRAVHPSAHCRRFLPR